MALGRVPRQTDLLRSTVDYCHGRVAADSVYGILHRECLSLFPDEMFADLFTDVGRRSVPPMIVAVVMVLQRIEGLSDREAVDRFAFDARWKYAAGGLDFDYPGFVHTVLVDMRARLASSAAPDRIFQVVLDVARQAGLVGRKRVVDSTPIYDAVATLDTVTLIRSAIRGLLAATAADLTVELRAAITSGDDYATTGKPQIDWDDPAAREALIDSRARDGFAMLTVLEGCELDQTVEQAARLLATVLGQDLTDGDNGAGDGVFRIAGKVAADQVISTVDTDARHGHKTNARGFDGYKGHLATDPDSEIITATEVTPGNSGDAEVAEKLLADILSAETKTETGEDDAAAAYGDTAYGSGELLERLDNANIQWTQSPAACGGERSFPQGPLRYRPGQPDRDLPGRCHRTHPSHHQRRRPARRARQVRPRLPHLPSGRAVHHGPLRAAPSQSATTRQPWPPPATGRPTPPGGPPTGPLAPKSNARSAT